MPPQKPHPVSLQPKAAATLRLSGVSTRDGNELWFTEATSSPKRRKTKAHFLTNGAHKRVNPDHYAHQKSHFIRGIILQGELTFLMDPLISGHWQMPPVRH